MSRRLVALGWTAAILGGCAPGDPPASTTSDAPSVAATHQPCVPRSAEKLGIPFVRVCPGDEEGFWISAEPIGCSAGKHDQMSCPLVSPLVHPVGASPSAIKPVTAAVIDPETAARLCFFRIGGRLPTRQERSSARAQMGLATVLVSESENESERFRFRELPEWVFEDGSKDCTGGVPTAKCVYGWFPSASLGPNVPWSGLRECEARHHPTAVPGVFHTSLGAGCVAPEPSWREGSEGTDLPCGVRSPAVEALGGPSPAVFTFRCSAPAEIAHPTTEDAKFAAYRCVVPESALGTFDVPGR